MNTPKNIYRTLARKITINLAQNHELRKNFENLQNQNRQLEETLSQLMTELNKLDLENNNLREILYTMNQENGHNLEQIR